MRHTGEKPRFQGKHRFLRRGRLHNDWVIGITNKSITQQENSLHLPPLWGRKSLFDIKT